MASVWLVGWLRKAGLGQVSSYVLNSNGICAVRERLVDV